MVIRGPGIEEGVSDRKHDRPDKDADQPERDQSADHSDEDQQEGQIGTLLDQPGSQEVVHGRDHHRPDQQPDGQADLAAPVKPDDGRQQHRDGTDLGERQQEHQRGQQRDRRHTDHRQTESGQQRLDDCGDHHAERDAAHRGCRKPCHAHALIAGKPTGKPQHRTGALLAIGIEHRSQQHAQQKLHADLADLAGFLEDPSGNCADIRHDLAEQRICAMLDNIGQETGDARSDHRQ